MTRTKLTCAGSALQACLALLVISQASHAQGLNAILTRSALLYADVRTARGTVEQTVINSLTRTTAVTHAEYQQQFPDLVSLRFTDPRGDLIVADGKAVWIYTPSVDAREALKAPMSYASTWVNLFDILLTAPATRFAVADSGRVTLQGVSVRVVVFAPKSEIPNLELAKLWIDEATGSIRQFEVTENAEVVRRIRFTALQLNAPVEAAKFQFTPPRNVAVKEIRN
jgi:chaperone LolA